MPKRDFSKVEITAVSFWGQHERNQGGVLIQWGMDEFGFGELTLYKKNGVLRADTECLNRDFVRAVLAKVADTITIDKDPSDLEEGTIISA